LPVLVHEVTIANPRHRARTELVGVLGRQPKLQASPPWRALLAPSYDAVADLERRQLGDAVDFAPLTIFLAAADAPVEVSKPTRAPSSVTEDAHTRAVIADTASDSIAAASLPALPARRLFAMRSPLTLAPAQASSCATSMHAHAEAIPASSPR